MLCQHNFQSLGKVQYFWQLFITFFFSKLHCQSLNIRKTVFAHKLTNEYFNFIKLHKYLFKSTAGLHFFQNSTASKISLDVSENYNTGICVSSFMFKLLKHGSIVMVILDTPTKVLMSVFFLVATFVMNVNNQSSRIPLLNY